MDAQEIRSLQEAYEAVYENQQLDEGLRILPRERMSNKAASKRLKAVGTKLKSKFTTAKGTTARNVEDEKSKKLVSQANKIDKVAAKHIPSDVEAKERKNRGGSWNPRNPMGSNEYAERQFAKNRAKLGIKEQVDVYDVILSHLLDEGYAETPEAAEVIMVNMSEDWREEIMEGMTMKDFKANRRKNKRRESSADARKRGHEGKTWADSGETYSTDAAKRRRANLSPLDRAVRHRVAVDPDYDRGREERDYPGGITKNPKKLRKQKAMGEH